MKTRIADGLRIGLCDVKVCVSDACGDAWHVKDFGDACVPEDGPHWILPGYNGIEADNVRAPTSPAGNKPLSLP